MATYADITSSLSGLSGGAQSPAEDKAGGPHPHNEQATSNDQALGAAAPAPAAAPVGQERRRSPRFECQGTAAIFAAGGDVSFTGALTNISLHGCYVETTLTLPLDTDVILAIDSLGFRIRAHARVRATYPSTGMGLCFSEMDAEQRAQLGLLVKALWSRKPSPS